MSIKIGNTAINKLYVGTAEIKKVYIGTNLILDNGTIDTVVTINTTSVSPTWTPYVENSGATLTWEVTGGVTRAPQVIDTPILNLEANTGTAIITITSSTAFAGFTVFKVDSLDVSAIDTSAIGSDMVEISCKDNAITTWDISSMTGLLELTFRSNSLLTAMDISSNTALTSIWGYSSALTALDVSANNSLTYLSMDNCALTTAELDAIVNDLDDNGASNGTLLISGNTGLPLTAASFDSYNDLETKTWTINVANSTPVDTEDPVVGTLYYANETSTTVELTCTATDNVGVVSFDIYLDAVLDRNVLGTSLSSYEFDGLTAETNYDIFAVAKDAADNESLASNIINFTTDATPTTDDGLHPTLTNFRVLDAQKGRVYFNSSEIITASTGVSGYTGFTITGKVISQITINTDSLTNHYFDVTVDFDFYDNNTIRYEGGSDLADSESNALYNFTLEYITNSITEPTASTNKYVTHDASGGNGSEGSPWTFEEAGTNAVAGETVWIKAGNYGNINVILSASGTLANPIKYKGYKTAIGDAGSLTRELDLSFNSTELPLLNGGGSGVGIISSLKDYIFIENIQVENYSTNIRIDDASFIVVDNVYSKDADVCLRFALSPSTNIRILNSYVADATAAGVWMYGAYHLIENTWSVSSRIVNMDYHFEINAGSNINGFSIFKDCYTHSYWEDSHGHHAIALKGTTSGLQQYNLIEDCTLENHAQGIECRHENSNYNVIRNCYGTRTASKKTTTFDESSLVTFRDGCTDNIVENSTMEELSSGILFNDNAGEEGSQAGGIDNKVINCVFNNNDSDIVIKNGIGGTALEPTGNEFLNCTFYNSTKLVANSIVPFGSSNIFTNCILESIPAYDGTPTFRYSDFYVSFPVPSGVGNISFKPYFTDAPNGDFSLSSETTDEVYEGGTDNGVYYDITDIERKTPFSMGAYEKQQEQTPVLSNFNITNSEPTKVYFNSSSSIIGMTTTSFTVSGKSIDSLTVNGSSTVGHYFTVTSAFTFWDNNTIRLDSDNVVREFTLEYITNNIVEPTSSGTEYFVTTTGNDGNDGLTEGNAFLTPKHCASIMDEGDIMYIKAGTYTDLNIEFNVGSGAIANPMQVIGYKTTPGDITSSYYNYGDGALLSTEMPLFNSGDRTTNRCFDLASNYRPSYLIFKNIQIENYKTGIEGRLVTGFVLDNIIISEMGDDTVNNSGDGLYFANSSPNSVHNLRAKNMLVQNCSMDGVLAIGNHNLFENVKVYADEDTLQTYSSMDYYIHFRGNNNIVRNSYTERVGTITHGGHGIGTKADVQSEYNLIVDSECKGFKDEAFYIAYALAKYNIVKRCVSTGNGANNSDGGTGYKFRDGASFNIIEQSLIKLHKYGLSIEETTEQLNNGFADDNTFRNMIVDECFWAIGIVASYNIGGDGVSTDTYQDNVIQNSTFNNCNYLIRNSGTSFNNLFINNVIYNVPSEFNFATTEFGWIPSYNNYWIFWGVNGTPPLGTGNISVNPNFVNLIDFVPQEESMTSPKITGVDYDYNNGERASTTTIGAVKLVSETP